MTFRDLKCFHGPRQLHCADTRWRALSYSANVDSLPVFLFLHALPHFCICSWRDCRITGHDSV
jgi:hypothetical protein